MPEKIFQVVIIGSGFAGLGMAIQLARAGIDDFIVLDKAASLGGTWRDNSYPGASCDVPTLLYSYSFEMNREWRYVYAPQQDILGYLNRCADKYRVRDRMRFNQEVTQARFDEESGIWHLVTRDGQSLASRFVVTAVGQLNLPNYPAIENLQAFSGPAFHSSRWDHAYDFTGKRVAVLGTGASAVQFVPELMSKVKELVLFQRSPTWISPKADRFKRWERMLLKAMPASARLLRWKMYWTIERTTSRYQTDSKLNQAIRTSSIKELSTLMPDEALREKLTPDYAPGCKRIPKSNDWFSSLSRSNARIVDAPAVRATANTIIAEDGREVPVDAIIFATGFRATEFMAPIEVVGIGGEVLAERWKDGAEAYRGVAIPSFPNLFMLYGPNTNSHNSAVGTIEAQIGYVLRHIKTCLKEQVRYMDTQDHAMRTYSQRLQSNVKAFAWSDGCNNWYRTASGKVTNNWPGYAFKYRLMMRLSDSGNYRFVRALNGRDDSERS